jgi:hypothetical protein
MKLVCISREYDNNGYDNCAYYGICDLNITIGMLYNTFECEDKYISSIYYLVCDDTGERIYYPKKLFITLQESRRIKLEKLGV